ncbi:hypothetical protein M758_3G202500 [Ceratodon purpureus]|uniref:Uncharacterized protein n=1 Tax=Ceratodon purpureus TaxID=3225 RepID=A0A8T0INB9_CERPU|nr:hypothetical protein KC19_3G203100 [Ceratodon purpureus]KAG0623789.1 hypothetical protein M758_3G202500 [Ceratodon purpureus]
MNVQNLIHNAALLIQNPSNARRSGWKNQFTSISTRKQTTLQRCGACGPHRHRHHHHHCRSFHHQRSSMSKKNKKSTRVKQHVFDLKREKEDQEKKAKKAEKQKVKVEQKKIKAENSMKVDSGISKAGKQIKKKSFKVGKTRKFQHDATTKAKAAQAMAMEIEK